MLEDKELERLEDMCNRLENEGFVHKPCSACSKEMEKANAVYDDLYSTYHNALSKIQEALGGDFTNALDSDVDNIVASINILRSTPGRSADKKMIDLRKEADAMRENFEIQRSLVERLETKVRALEASKANLLTSIDIKDKRSKELSSELEEAREEARLLSRGNNDALREIGNLERVIQEAHTILDGTFGPDDKLVLKDRLYSITSGKKKDFTIDEVVDALEEYLERSKSYQDPEWEDYLRLRQRFEGE